MICHGASLREVDLSLRVTGLKKYDLNHCDRVMCQLFQNKVRFCLVYGRSKFSGSCTPSQRPIPIAISVYPEKSNRIWKAYAYSRNQLQPAP